MVERISLGSPDSLPDMASECRVIYVFLILFQVSSNIDFSL